jgi:large subunit ribosomal protein L19
MSELIESIERALLRKDLPRFQVGDRLRVHFQVIEGTRRRTQPFEGIVIKMQGSGSRRTFTVRKISFGVGVERTFPLHSPKIERLEVMARGEVRRAKLYYLRGRVGRRARVRESRDFRPEQAQMPAAPVPDGAEGDGVGPGAEAAETLEAQEHTEAATTAEASGAAEDGEGTPAPEPEPEQASHDAGPDSEGEPEEATAGPAAEGEEKG